MRSLVLRSSPSIFIASFALFFSSVAFAQVPTAQVPTSTSGTSIAPAGPLMPATATPSTSPAPTPMAPSDVTVDNRFRMLEARLNTDEQIEKDQAASIAWLRRFKVSGFVQPQLLVQVYNAAASPNLQANGSLPPGVGANDALAIANGTSTNGTFFRLRRARLKTEFMPSDYARLVFEIDPTPVGGATSGVGTVARNIEAVGIAHWSKDFVAEYGVGIFKLPFGFEVPESDADRIFIERSWGEQNMFPGEYDTGARATGWMFEKKLYGSIAVVNGVTEGEKTFALVPDLNRGKDVVGRVTYDFGPLTPGISGYVGEGQNVDATNLRFKQFPRWALNFELLAQHSFSKSLGNTRLIGEITRAQNMDRGVKYGFGLPSFPKVITDDAISHDELAAYVRAEQDLSEWFTLALRWDYYSPDTAQATNDRNTFAVAGAVHFTKGLQMMLEFDHAIDQAHAPNALITRKEYEMFSSVLQARF